MDIRQAILKAADQIDRAPERYDFSQVTKARPDCGTPACMIGWIGLFAGSKSVLVSEICTEVLGIDAQAFYDRVRTLNSAGLCGLLPPSEVPAILRAYVDKFHPAESRALIPESVARIFRMSHAELTRELA